MIANRWLIAGILSTAIILTALYKVWPILHPPSGMRLALNADCDLRTGPCALPLPTAGTVELSIAPTGIPIATPLQVRVTIEGLNIDSAQLDFAGVDMNMGYNRTPLTPIGAGRYQGAAMLPACVRRRMFWEATVVLQTPTETVLAPFRFETESR